VGLVGAVASVLTRANPFAGQDHNPRWLCWAPQSSIPPPPTTHALTPHPPPLLRWQDNVHAVVPEDLRPLLAGILLSHPGLEFLQEAPEFQERCAGRQRRELLGCRRSCSEPRRCCCWRRARALFRADRQLGLRMLRPSVLCRYAETVIHRIFYHNNRLGDGRITWREFRRCGPQPPAARRGGGSSVKGGAAGRGLLC
jgi:hypothetical protein